MDFPPFESDEAMAVWFEENDVSAADLEEAHDVVISPDLSVVLLARLYDVAGPTTSRATNAVVASSGRRQAVVEPVLN